MDSRALLEQYEGIEHFEIVSRKTKEDYQVNNDTIDCFFIVHYGILSLC